MHALTVARLVAAVFLFLPCTVLAGPVVISDQLDSSATYMRGDYAGYSSPNFVNRSAVGQHWGDELFSPGHRFDTSQILVERSESALVITLRTMFNGNDLGARYADIFIDTATPGSLDGFNYAISLGGQSLPVGIYSVNGRATSNDVWSGRSGYVYGGYSQFRVSSPDFTAAMAYENPVRVTAGTELSAFHVLMSSVAVGGGDSDLIVAVTGAPTALFAAMDLFWATGDCGNDVVWGTALTLGDVGVPAPYAIALLLSGLSILLGLRVLKCAGNRSAEVREQRA